MYEEVILLGGRNAEEKIHNKMVGMKLPYLINSESYFLLNHYNESYVAVWAGGTLLYWIVGSIWRVMIYHVLIRDITK